MPLTCTVASPPDHCKITLSLPPYAVPNLHLYYGVADHPWRDRNRSWRPIWPVGVVVADHPWRDRNA
ncbi:Hypothetical protein FRAAL5576 [Frankia alni ACN14a]|uniref:Uncharacterized protein n=1 Tax=Frankia alni (strain DSM 45986 / CECT 9034 / ACN14a) TaxID=326424 RepID=Q0REA2_FRAAA|nr:Hypothetical protein FRAAL5576 [Frankia alni ACN14a]